MSEDQPRDNDGKFASFMGAHAKLDKLAANAHAKINESAPPQYGVMRNGKSTLVVASKDGKSEYIVKHKTLSAANADAARRQKSHNENHQYNMEARSARGQRARSYLQTRAGRDAKYGKQLKFSF